MPSLPERLQQFYETCTWERESALERLPYLFADDVRFRDPFRQTTGLPALRQLFVRMFKQYKHVAFTDFRVDGNDQAFTMTYNMHLKMAVGPTFVTPMCSVVRATGGKVIDLVDYYDFYSGLVPPLPAVANIYRGVINKLFL